MNPASKKHNVLKLKGECTIYQASELYQQAIDFIDKEGGLDVDMKNITRIDTCIVQLFLAIKKQQERNQLNFVVSQFSDTVADFVNSIYCSELFEE